MTSATSPAWAFITPSYSGDHRRCLLLCRSMDALLAGNWKHYIVVDKPHYEMFRPLRGPRRDVMLTEDVLPGKMRLLFHMPFLGGRSVWWSKTSGLSIGWHLQQMVKIGMAAHLAEDGLAYCDSDTFFIKPFDVAKLTQGPLFRLLRSAQSTAVEAAPNPAFTRAALDMLALPTPSEVHGYVDNFVTWKRSVALGLQERLAHFNGGEWRRAFRNRVNVSEYNLYGLYADKVLGDAAGHWHTSQHLCKTQWSRKSMGPVDVTEFCASLQPHEVMIGIQSFAGVDVGLLEQQLDKALGKAMAS